MTDRVDDLDRLDEVRQAVLGMPMARTLGLSFLDIRVGAVELAMPVLPGWCFRPGQLQAAAVFAIADFAAVAAAASLLPRGAANATIDAQIKLLAPARGERLVASGRVIHATRMLTVCAAEVFAEEDGHQALCATLLGTARNLNATAPGTST